MDTADQAEGCRPAVPGRGKWAPGATRRYKRAAAANVPKRRIADEYDAAQERGEVATVGKRSQPERLNPAPPSAADIGLSHKEIHEARIIRDAEIAEPGICAPQDLRRDAVISPSVCHELAPRLGDFQLYRWPRRVVGCIKRRNITSRQARAG
jgi:hypothetical protein